ncbi:GNAT family N-acetyltransferase [Sphingomonas endolithica]|uniref:GNAT family N-acetyltransferase n=1 Tax=Sphingomonas endolithica TaxID=2972485 RepID=UPI0021AF2A61|nr:GNAT family N-acetyltransferase [Sphingomonas sp. ZFBP2030]
MRIVRDDLTHPAVLALLDMHVREAHATSPADGVFALDLTGLRDPALTLWSAWDGETLLGLGALKELDATHGELKSMRTAPDQLRRGVAAAMLAHLIAEARARGYQRLSLETGTNAPFAPARALYEAVGFVPSGPFGDYKLTDFNRCYTLALG